MKSIAGNNFKMKGVKKRTGFILIFLIFLCIPVSASSEVVLRMIGPEDIGGAWAEIIRIFHERHPDLKIDYISGPWSTDERQNMYIRSFLGGDPFELIYMDVTWTANFAQRDWLLPLDSWFPQEEKEKFLPGDIQASHYQKHLYRVPVRSDVGMLYYRKDLISNPPKTWKEFEHLCRTTSSPPDRYGIVFQGMQYEGLVCNYLEYLWGAGGTILDENEKVCLESRENIEALRFMKKIIEESWTPRSVITFQEQHSLEFFEKGKALFMRNWPYAWLRLSHSPLKGKVGIVPFIHKTGQKPAGTLGGWGLGIARGLKHREAAWKFIQFATSVNAQKILHRKRGAVPTRKSLFEDADIQKESPYYKELYNVLLRARPRPVHPDYARMSAILQKHVSAVLVGIEHPPDAALAMDRSVSSTIRGKGLPWFRRLAVDYDLHKTVKNTLLFTILSVPFELFLGLCFALILNAPLRGRAVTRLSVLIPWALPTAVMAMGWQWMFNNPFGVINDVLVRIGLIQEPLNWLSSPQGAMFAAVFADIWKTTPFVTIILLAGLQSIPKELMESLSLDGAGFSKRLSYLILPMLIPFIRVALIFRVIHAAGIFDLIWVLTKGGPADGTRTLSLYIYDLAFRFDEIGYGFFLTLLFLMTFILASFVMVKATTLRYEKVPK
jgi:multiple sugar transport system substrate-binding protein